MAKKLVLAGILVLVLVASGCVMDTFTGTEAPPDEADAAAPEPQEMVEIEQNCTEAYEAYQVCLGTLPKETCEALLGDCVAEYITEKTESEMSSVLDYIIAHPHDEFPEQATRIKTVRISEDAIALLNYTTSNTDPSYESWYLCGVLFIVFPEVDEVHVMGFNKQDKLIDASEKYPNRDAYTYSAIHFPGQAGQAYEECTTDADCDDDENCTRDTCFNGRCTNVWTVKSGCEI